MSANLKLPFPVVPGDTTEGVSHYAKYGVGGYYSLDTIEDRDSIPESRLDTGLIVYITKTNKTYRYTGSSWEEIIMISPSEFKNLKDWIEED